MEEKNSLSSLNLQSLALLAGVEVELEDDDGSESQIEG